MKCCTQQYSCSSNRYFNGITTRGQLEEELALLFVYMYALSHSCHLLLQALIEIVNQSKSFHICLKNKRKDNKLNVKTEKT